MGWFSRQRRDPVFWGGVAVVIVTQIAYLMTMNLSCPFWDSGEFIATSYVLGIPHPPGTPLYVLIGRLFTLFPFASIATRVNYLSVLPSTLTALFTYLITINFARRLRRREESGIDRWLAIGGGIVAAFFTAFGRTFWDDAIEAEVYSLASLVMVLGVWLALRWEKSVERGAPDHNLLLLIGYLLVVAIGIHMGALLAAPPILIFVLAVAPATVWNSRFMRAVLLAGAAVVGFILLKALGVPVGVALALAVAAFALATAYDWRRAGERNLAFWMISLAVLALTVQLFMIVRARLDPPINEADPDNWEALWLVLSRDQYKPPNPFLLRQASWPVQLGKHFWRYFHDQYNLGLRPAWFAMMLPIAIGAVGAVVQAVRDRRRFIFMAALVFFTTLFLVFYLNFKDDEVRDRDYFFVMGYHFFAIWIGLGAVAIAQWLRGEPRREAGVWHEPPGGKLFGLGAVGVFVLMSLLPMRHGWHEHDRTGFYVARDYAWNMLEPLGQNAIVFTNGDNDTFPLWYLQEVEGVRKDVRVVNLSLLNTHWYIRQLRDTGPKVKITLPETDINRLHAFMIPESGEVILVKDIMVRQILNDNWDTRPVYIAVTVPETMSLENHMMMEGLVYRLVEKEYDGEQIDVETTMHNLREVFRYRGLLDANGYYDDRVYKDSTARKLIQNYAAAYVHVAHHYLSVDDNAKAVDALEYARRINPTFAGVVYTQGYLWLQMNEYEKAEKAFRDLIAMGENTADVYRLLVAALEGEGRRDEADATFRAALAANPDSFSFYQLYFTHLWTKDRRQEAVAVIEDWLAKHPGDRATRRALDELLHPAPEGAPSASDSQGKSQ